MAQSANDKIQVALIGSGGMGMGDARNAIDHGGAQILAASDLYYVRLTRMKESFGSHVFTTRDFREVLARKDVDAVIIATPDHYHSRISIDAMKAGKDVYCQKPMVQTIAQGYDVIATQKKTGRIFMVGSQYVSSQTYHKAKQLLASGAIGELNMVQSWLDRNSANAVAVVAPIRPKTIEDVASGAINVAEISPPHVCAGENVSPLISTFDGAPVIPETVKVTFLSTQPETWHPPAFTG